MFCQRLWMAQVARLLFAAVRKAPVMKQPSRELVLRFGTGVFSFLGVSRPRARDAVPIITVTLTLMLSIIIIVIISVVVITHHTSQHPSVPRLTMSMKSTWSKHVLLPFPFVPTEIAAPIWRPKKRPSMFRKANRAVYKKGC